MVYPKNFGPTLDLDGRKKATLATSGDNVQGRVGVRDERPDDGLHEATRNNERPTWTPCRWLSERSVDPICDLTCA